MADQQTNDLPYGDIAQEAGATLRHGSSAIANMPGGLVLGLVVVAGLNVIVLALVAWTVGSFLTKSFESDEKASTETGMFLNQAIDQMHATMQRQAEMFERMLQEQQRANAGQVERALDMAEQAMQALVDDSTRAGQAAVDALGQAGDIAAERAGE